MGAGYTNQRVGPGLHSNQGVDSWHRQTPSLYTFNIMLISSRIPAFPSLQKVKVVTSHFKKSKIMPISPMALTCPMPGMYRQFRPRVSAKNGVWLMSTYTTRTYSVSHRSSRTEQQPAQTIYRPTLYMGTTVPRMHACCFMVMCLIPIKAGVCFNWAGVSCQPSPNWVPE